MKATVHSQDCLPLKTPQVSWKGREQSTESICPLPPAVARVSDPEKRLLKASDLLHPLKASNLLHPLKAPDLLHLLLCQAAP